jgi:hypothetical protein
MPWDIARDAARMLLWTGRAAHPVQWIPEWREEAEAEAWEAAGPK